MEQAIEEDEVNFALNAAILSELKTFEEAVKSPDSGKWLEAMDSEIKSFKTNEVFELINLPEGRKPVTCKWCYKLKKDANGKVQ